MSPTKRTTADFISEVVATVPGWTPFDQLLALHTLALSTGSVGGDFVELGSWCGRSTVVLADAAKALTDVRVHAIDLFPERSDWSMNADGSYSFSVDLPELGRRDGYKSQTVWAEPWHRDIAPVYEQFGSVRNAFDVSLATFAADEIVTVHRGDSTVIATIPDLEIRFAFIDGDHSYTAVSQDILHVESRLKPRGWITFDDAFSHYQGVDDAIRDLIIGSGGYVCATQVTRKMFAAQRLDASERRTVVTA